VTCRNIVSCLVLVISVVAACSANAQQEASTACTFDDGKQITVKYQSVPATHKLPDDRIWSPGKSPMFLFTSGALKLGNVDVPVGAYSMFVVPGKDRWTLVLNKNVAPNAHYDEQEDLLRVPMDLGTLSEPAKTVGIYFGHVAPKQCNMRIYYGTTGAWAEFHEE